MGRKIKYKFTPVDNKMFEALIKLRLPIYDRAVFDTVVRKTAGFGVREKWIAWSKFTEMTGIDKRHVSRSIRSLIRRNMIVKNGKIYSIQPDLTKWQGVPPEAHLDKGPPEAHLRASRGTLKVPVEAQTKETLKETFKRKVFSKKEEEEKKEIINKGLEGLKEAIVKAGEYKK